MATEVAERHGIKLQEARDLLASVDLEEPSEDASLAVEQTDAPIEQPKIDVRPVLAAGVREIAGEVRNSLDFHRSQEGGGEVSGVVLSGAALQIRGFSQALQSELRVPLTPQTVGLLEDDAAGTVSAERLAIATGLAVEEAPR
jgi:Tfp pilus assembly PilM family ATPase